MKKQKLTPEEARKIADDFTLLANNTASPKQEKNMEDLEKNIKDGLLGTIFNIFNK